MAKMRDRAGAAAEAAGRAVRSLPGLAAVGCGVTGAAIIWGTGVAFLVAAGFLLAIDRAV